MGKPDTYFDELPAVMKQVPLLPGEEALYRWIASVVEASDKDPEIKKTLTETATTVDAEMITPFLQWRYNGRPAGNGYLNRTATGKSNIYDNRPEETKYIYTDDHSKGNPLKGQNTYAITFAKGGLPSVKGFWSLTLYKEEHFFQPNTLNRYTWMVR